MQYVAPRHELGTVHKLLVQLAPKIPPKKGVLAFRVWIFSFVSLKW
jgi:hypothetical protein